MFGLSTPIYINKVKRWLIIILSFAMLPSWAETSAVDSLRSLLPNASDKERLVLLRDIYEQTEMIGTLDEMEQAINQYQHEAERQGNVQVASSAMMMRLLAYYSHTEFERLRSAMPAFLDYNGKKEMWENYYNGWSLLADALCYSGRNYEALREARKMYDDAKSHKQVHGLATANRLMGTIYSSMGDNKMAKKNYEKAIAMLKKENDDRKYCDVFCAFYAEYWSTLTSLQDYDELAKITDHWQHCINVWERYLKDNNQDTGQLRPPRTYCMLAQTDVAIHKHRMDEARRLLAKVDSLNGDSEPILSTTINGEHAEYHKAMGNLPMACQYTRKRLDICKELGDTIGMVNAQWTLAELLYDMGNKTASADILIHLINKKDSLSAAETQTQLNSLYAVAQTDERLIAAQQKEERILKMVLIGGALAALLVIGILAFLVSRLGRANARATESNRMKTSFIRNMNHEIRTPLNIVTGFAEVLTTPGMGVSRSEPPEVRARMRQASDNITATLDNLLVLSEVESMTQLDHNDRQTLDGIINEAVENTGVAELPGIAFERITDWPDDFTIATNRKALLTIIENLLSNARKFTTQGKITLEGAQTEKGIRIAVTDTGIGIPASDRKRVFHSFVKLNDFSEGVGIGLTLSQILAGKLGGDITIDPDYTTGARFLLTLPL